MEQLPLIAIDRNMVQPNNYNVTKANALVEANYRLTLTQQRIVLLMASMVQPGDEDFKIYRIHVKDLLDILDVTRPNLYVQMILMIRDLMRSVVTIPLSDEKHLDTHWISNQVYEVGGGYSDITFDPRLKPFLLHLKERFTTYKLENVIRLKSIYSIRIYELLKQYQGIGKRVLTIEALRKMMGIGSNEYDRYNDFKRYVLQVAHREINAKTDISFGYREIKLGRKVHELEFTITRKAPPAEPDKAAKQREKERKRQKDEALKKAQQREKIEKYLAQLSAEELNALRKEAEGQARKDGGAAFKERCISETMINGYVYTIVEHKLKKRGVR